MYGLDALLWAVEQRLYVRRASGVSSIPGLAVEGAPVTVANSLPVGRRTFLRCAVGAAFGLAACAKGRAQSAADVLVRVGYEDAGQEIAPDFTGLSYESAILAPGDYFAPNNASVVGLIRLLGASGVVRIGGNTSADALWRAAAAPARRSEEHTSELQSLRHLVCRLL